MCSCRCVCVSGGEVGGEIARRRRRRMLRPRRLHIVKLCHCTRDLYYLKWSYKAAAAGAQHSSEPLANQKICIQAENKERHNQKRTADSHNDHLFVLWKIESITEKCTFVAVTLPMQNGYYVLHNKPPRRIQYFSGYYSGSCASGDKWTVSLKWPKPLFNMVQQGIKNDQKSQTDSGKLHTFSLLWVFCPLPVFAKNQEWLCYIILPLLKKYSIYSSIVMNLHYYTTAYFSEYYSCSFSSGDKWVSWMTKNII